MNSPVYDKLGIQAHLGNCVDVMRGMEPESIHAILTDPPYGLAELSTEKVVKALTEWVSGNREYIPASGKGFMSKSWDRFVPPPAAWDECYRVMKPGAYMLVFAGMRTADLMGISIRLAGFRICDTIQWVYASGMPKGLNIGKAIDRAAGAEREIVGSKLGQPGYSLAPSNNNHRTYSRGLGNTSDPEAECAVTAPATDAAKQWDGWNTALKPSQEPVIIAQKPLVGDGTLGEIGSYLARLEAECKLTAKHVALNSQPTRPSEPVVTVGSAHEDAATPLADDLVQPMATGKAADSNEATGTLLSASVMDTNWNIVTSWSKCWAELYALANTSITKIGSETTTDLKTLLSCLSRITLENITQAQTSANGSPSIVEVVDNLFAGCVLHSRAIRMLSATENAIDVTPTSHLDGIAPQDRPAAEPIIVAQKPFKGTIAGNVLEHGTGGMNIDGCRVATTDDLNGGAYSAGSRRDVQTCLEGGVLHNGIGDYKQPDGRWPTNIVFSHSEDCTEYSCVDGCPVAELDRQSGVQRDGVAVRRNIPPETRTSWYGTRSSQTGADVGYGGEGGASRFFPCFRYEAKAPRSERPRVAGESHSTVKPVALQRHFARLITPPGGTILDCFAGTGSTGQAARAEGFKCILIDNDPQAMEWIRARLDAHPKTEAPAPGEALIEPEGDLLDLLALLDNDEDVSP